MNDLDYYGYAPLIRPDRPLCLVGLPGSDVGMVARLLSILTGLPSVWLDRAVEHKAGVAVDGIVLARGEAARLDLERELLPPVLRRTTAHLIALGETTLLDPALGALVRSTSTVVYVRKPRATLVATMVDQRRRKPNLWARLLVDAEPTERGLAAQFDRFEAPMLRADHVVDEPSPHAQPAARSVLAALGWELPAVWETPEPG
jgi:shikimate kinase